MSSSLRGRLARLTVVTTLKNQMAKTAFAEYVPVCCSHEEYCELEPSDCGGPGFITVRATSRERYAAKVAELRADGAWHLLEG